MTSRQEIMTRLRGMKGELATRYDVRETGIAGSVSLSQNNVDQTPCIVVEFGPDADLITYISLWHYLEDTFGPGTDLISKKALRYGWKDAIMQDLVFV